LMNGCRNACSPIACAENGARTLGARLCGHIIQRKAGLELVNSAGLLNEGQHLRSTTPISTQREFPDAGLPVFTERLLKLQQALYGSAAPVMNRLPDISDDPERLSFVRKLADQLHHGLSHVLILIDEDMLKLVGYFGVRRAV